MVVEAEDNDFEALITGTSPRDFGLPDSEVAPLRTLQMLRDLAGKIRLQFRPSAWLIVEHGEIVGLCSVVRPPAAGGVVEIGYGVAPTRRRRGIASRAVADMVGWAKSDKRVSTLAAETAPTNRPSQRALESAGFHMVAERVDEEDGPLLCWQLETPS